MYIIYTEIKCLPLGESSDSADEDSDEPNYLKNIEDAKKAKADGDEYSYDFKDVILYSTFSHKAYWLEEYLILANRPRHRR